MRSQEEILKCGRLIIHEHSKSFCCGEIVFTKWSGTFVCGYNENGWEHVSVAPYKRRYAPSWDDMCAVKDLFWNEDEAVIEIHPQKNEYVNIVENCLHLWRNKNMELPR